ncbi:MAG: hypothetical protein GF315_04225 [candidate division Zixibacteria bacterium]|nr:hypothetical protein [candidate division Zixibacteria bacterium]
MKLLSERIKHNMIGFERIMIKPATMSSVFSMGSDSLINAEFHCLEALLGEESTTAIKLSLSKNEHPSRWGAAWGIFQSAFGGKARRGDPYPIKATENDPVTVSATITDMVAGHSRGLPNTVLRGAANGGLAAFL